MNFIDTHIRAGTHSSIAPRQVPFICGIEGAGTVVSCNRLLKRFKVGDRVVYSGVGSAASAGSYARCEITVDCLNVQSKPAVY